MSKQMRAVPRLTRPLLVQICYQRAHVDSLHIGAFRRLQAFIGVLEDQAQCRIHVHTLGSLQKKGRGRFSFLNIVDRDDRVEQIKQATGLQRSFRQETLSAGRNRHRNSPVMPARDRRDLGNLLHFMNDRSES